MAPGPYFVLDMFCQIQAVKVCILFDTLMLFKTCLKKRHLKEIVAVIKLPNFETIILDNIIMRIFRVLTQQHEAVIN